MEVTPGFEPGITVLQTVALPLGYVAILARVAGFEPANDGIRIRCLTAWLYPINVLYYTSPERGIQEIIGVDGGIRTHEYWSHNPGS